MKDYMKSYTTGRIYCPSECIRIINLRQITFYAKMGVEILDFYPSTDFKTGEDILVFIVNKKDSQEAYQKWQEMRYE